ncbi:MAG: glycoside hydrolase family 2 protein, partial [Promicromonosporaceae bacterium]|nr:glycoside hydrolase family 2 protein [Promicromonosporaceae bacterium]
MSLLPSTFRPLHDGWRLTAVSGPVPDSLKRALAGRIPATVPGEAHLDLLAAGLIADPFDGDNEAAQQWIGDTTWRYETTFEWIPAGEPAETTRMRHDLLACGLDTVAAVELNGHLVGRTQNQHRSYRWDVRPYLREGTNNLAVTFAAPVPEAKRRADTFGALPRVNHHEYNQLRKMACSFGWDWGIDVAGAGIWKPLGLDSWAGARIASVRPLVDVEGADGILRCHIEIERATENDIPVTLTLTPPQVGSTSSTTAPLATSAIIPAGKNSTTIEVRVPNVALWWPRGHGAQSRYELTISLLAATTWRGRIGFRTVTVDTTADEQGAPFNVIVNGKLIAIRGANWIPDHAFLTRITRERYARGISDAVAANMNLLRVWGGGSYELAEFYDLADEAGLLIWQDFPFACAAYPEDDDTAAEIEAEAREHIVRLSPHPSLIIWCGNNENTWGFVDWGWGGTLAGRGWGDRYYSDLLPSLLAELDPTRFYTPASPYSFGDYRHPNDFRYGLSHSWEPWNRLPYGEYRNISARFISEFGWQGPPAWATLISVVHDEPLNPFG